MAVLGWYGWFTLLIVTLWYTRKATNIASDTAQRQLRAYLSGEPGGINQLIGKRNEGIGHITIRNVGKLPARNVVVHVYMEIVDGRTAEFAVGIDDKPIDRVIQPGADMRQGSKKPYIPVSKLCTGGEYVYVWGVAYYDDGYDNRRFTRFCHRYSTASHNREVTADLSRETLGVKFAGTLKTRSIIDADKARYHTNGNDAD